VADEVYSVRDGINMVRYAMKMMYSDKVSKEDALHRALLMILGEEAIRYE
ncbi:MAG: MoxR family ATPase, partial [Deltaproteobacteria bacterium]|nr:MoxR family ATPase [Deltaproteobacteria bacterium]